MHPITLRPTDSMRLHCRTGVLFQVADADIRDVMIPVTLCRQAVDSSAECVAAARKAEVSLTGGAQQSSPDLIAGTAFEQTVAYGCSVFERPDTTTLLFNSHSSAAECGSLPGFYCLCREPPAASSELPIMSASLPRLGPPLTATRADDVHREVAATSADEDWKTDSTSESPRQTANTYEALTSGSTCEDAGLEVGRRAAQIIAAHAWHLYYN